MVSNKQRSRPLWILKIHQRLSIKKFKSDAKWLAEMKGDDICWVLKASPCERVYQVTVETMENCETTDREIKMWIPEGLAKATGEMFEKFKEQDVESIEEEEDIEDEKEVEKQYEELVADKSFDPYETSEPLDDSFNAFMDDFFSV